MLLSNTAVVFLSGICLSEIIFHQMGSEPPPCSSPFTHLCRTTSPRIPFLKHDQFVIHCVYHCPNISKDQCALAKAMPLGSAVRLENSRNQTGLNTCSRSCNRRRLSPS